MKVSEDGKVLKEISIPELLYNNGMQPVLTSTAHKFRKQMKWDRETLHLNKIAELTSDIADDFPLFETGDLVLSLRNLNLIVVLDLKPEKVKWWRIGPWIRQHDPEFQPGGTITVFNNNMYQTTFGTTRYTCPVTAPRISNIIEIDPVSGEYRIVYGSRKGQEMLSVLRGKQKATRSGGLFITEFEGGRVFETDSQGRIIWEYINRYDSDEVAEITVARVYPKGYFKVEDWSNCEKGEN